MWKFRTGFRLNSLNVLLGAQKSLQIQDASRTKLNKYLSGASGGGHK